MIRDANLIEHLPLFLQEFRELYSILDTENPEFKYLFDESEKIKNNQFIKTCDLVGIKKFENILNITPGKNDDLEARILRVLSRWNDIDPYTYKALIKKLIQLCNGENFSINSDFKNYRLEIITHLELAGQVDELQYLLGYMLPMNIEVISKNDIYCNSIGYYKFASGIVNCSTFELSDAIKLNIGLESNLNINGITIGCCEVEVSDNIKLDIEIENNLNVSGINIGSCEIEISDNFKENININSNESLGATIVMTEINSIN